MWFQKPPPRLTSFYPNWSGLLNVSDKPCAATRGSSVKAAVGDRIPVHGLHVGDATRCGEVLEVKGAGGEPPYVVRWDDGHEAVFVPGSGVRVDPAGAAADGPG